MIKQDHLIIFTRYPEAGKTKTRLIPALGAEGAAQLQQQMTEHTLRCVRELALTYPLSVEIRFTGDDRTLMQAWLGTDLTYQLQEEGDLGERMSCTFQVAFEQGAERVIIIGSDCPDVDDLKLREAFQTLQQHDLVLGPAIDGGYYLIGLRQFIPQLFFNIAWSTSVVLQQTIAIAQSLSLNVAYLTPLADVDYPEDLSVWERVQAELAQLNKGKISVILPVLNEENRIQRTLKRIKQEANLEVIVVDGGSQDQTVALAKTCQVKVVSSRPGRARQMNLGAKMATGEILLFLHVDTQLPDSFSECICQTLNHPNIIAGAFELTIDSRLPGLRLVEWGVRWRSRLLQLPYGDQAIFLKAETFKQVGGFPDLPLMEDFELMLRLRKLGKIAIAPVPVLTSGRRWEKLGVWQTTLLNQWIILAYFLKVPPAQLARWYREWKGWFSNKN